MKIREHVPIASLTTMRLGGAARFVIEIQELEDVEAAIQFAEEKQLPVWFMGDGANTIGKDSGFDGVIILNRLKGIKILAEAGNTLQLEAFGGEEWDNLVEFACQKGYSGIEAMSMIPGTAGAAPVQNIGAYGQDIASVIRSVKAYDTKTHLIVNIPKAEMGMEYRHTRFNAGRDAGRFLILSITICLDKNFLKPPFYTSLQNYIEQHHESDFSPMNIRKMVTAIRKEKLPDPAVEASAGSFFKNVYLDASETDEAEERGIPVWRNSDGSGKINAGWLIEACGLKGKQLYGFKISDKAALVLINENARSYDDLAKARAEVVKQVEQKFGYKLEQEPVEI